jgi:hypothetical protein
LPEGVGIERLAQKLAVTRHLIPETRT